MDLSAVAKLVTSKCGVSVVVERGFQGDEQLFLISFTDLHPHETIGARVTFEFRGIRSEVFFGPFAGMTLERLAAAQQSAMERFVSHCETLQRSNVIVELRLDGVETPITEFAGRRGQWSRIGWALKSRPMVVPSLEDNSTQQLVAHWGALTLSLALDLLDLEPINELSVAMSEGVRYEGRELEVLSRRYERDRIARELCIAHFGYACVACSRVLADVYGIVAHQFIHVHHKNPLSLKKSEAVVDPVHDLVPVCPNCHAMLHQKSPPYSVEELREMLKRQARSSSNATV
jgi:5-methylcytosine-specific restriction protein A